MFNDTINCLQKSKDGFEATVKDSFGDSIISEQYVPLLETMNSINNFNEVSKSEEISIKTLLASLRLIV